MPSTLSTALDRNNAKREFYLTDIVGHRPRHGLALPHVELPAEELIGVNTRAELAEAEALMQHRLRAAAMAAGATLIAPETVFLSADTRLGRDVVVEPNVVFGPGVDIGDSVRIRSFSHLEGATIGDGAIVGPFARLRPGAVLEDDVHVGNFVEVKATRLGAGAKANHLSYLGDSDGRRGTQYRRRHDHLQLRRLQQAPHDNRRGRLYRLEHRAGGAGHGRRRRDVAAGSVVTRDVPADALTIARGRQVDKPGRATEIRARLRRKD